MGRCDDRGIGNRCSRSRRRGRPLTGGSCGGLARLFFKDCGGLGGSVRLRLSLNSSANFFSYIDRDRAGVSLFLGKAEAGQKVYDGLRFDFELAGQLVNSNLIGVGHQFRLGHLLL